MTYLVIHHLMSGIPLAPCQAKLINIFLHLKSVNSRPPAFYTSALELWATDGDRATDFREIPHHWRATGNHVAWHRGEACSLPGISPSSSAPRELPVTHNSLFSARWISWPPFCLRVLPLISLLLSSKSEQGYTHKEDDSNCNS